MDEHKLEAAKAENERLREKLNVVERNRSDDEDRYELEIKQLREALEELAAEACGTCQLGVDGLGDGMCAGCFAAHALEIEDRTALSPIG